jgi:hypothetical protein
MKLLVDKPDVLQREFDSLMLSPLVDSMSRTAPQFQVKDSSGKFVQGAAQKLRWWMDYGKEYPQLCQAAVRLLSMHTTTCASERNWSLWGTIYTKARNRLALERANKLVFIRGNGRQAMVQEDTIMLSLLEQEPQAAATPAGTSAGPSTKRAAQGGAEGASKKQKTAI